MHGNLSGRDRVPYQLRYQVCHKKAKKSGEEDIPRRPHTFCINDPHGAARRIPFAPIKKVTENGQFPDKRGKFMNI
jgi:hypothetical protein